MAHDYNQCDASPRSAFRAASLAFLALLGIDAGQARAADFHVSEMGSDDNPCTAAAPCRTIGRACQAIAGTPEPSRDAVHVADGTYSGACDVAHYRFVWVIGNCAAPAKVKVLGAPNATIFHVQDHSTLHIRCMELGSHGNGTIGFASRQYAIGDYDNIRWGHMPGGIHVSVQEASKINCTGPSWIVRDPGGNGGALQHMQASNQSQVYCTTSIDIPERVTFADSFVSITWRSLGYFPGLSVTGAGIVGQKYRVVDGTLIGADNLPGRRSSTAHNGVSVP